MEKRLEIYSPSDGIYVKKDNGTEVTYYLFPEFEVHLNRIPPHSVQEWHYHSHIEEVLVIQKGVLTCRHLEAGEVIEGSLKAGQLVRVGQSVHTFANETDDWAEFTVYRMVPEGVDKSAVIKQDKTVVPQPKQ